MGDESALEARLERAHTVIGDLLRSLGEVDLLPERQQVAAREAVAFLEEAKERTLLSVKGWYTADVAARMREMAGIKPASGLRPIDITPSVPGDLPEDIKRQVIRDGWAPPIRRLLERAAELRAEVERLTSDLVQSEERRNRAEEAALAAERHNKETHELVAIALDYPGWERAGWKDLVAAVERDHRDHREAIERIGHAHDRGVAMWREITQSHMTLPPDRAELMSWLLTKLEDDQREHASYVTNLQHAHAHESAELRAEVDKAISTRVSALAAVRAILPPGDEQVPIAQRVAQLVREHGEMVAEMMKAADPEDIADAAARLSEPQPVPAAELGAVEFIDVVFDGPPGPTSSFVEVEDHRGHSMGVGEWLDRGDGMWALRIPMQPPAELGEVMAAAGALSALTAVVATSGMDWRRSPCLAWVYGVLVGHDRDVLEDLQMVFHWPDGTVDEIDRHRRALLAARGA